MMYSPFYGGSYSAISPTHMQADAAAGHVSRSRSRGPSPLGGNNNMGSGMSPFGGAASSPSPMPGSHHQQQQVNSPGMYGTPGGGSGPAIFHQHFGVQKGGQQQKQRYAAPPPPPPQRNTNNDHNFTIPAGCRNMSSLSVAIPHASADSMASPLPSATMMGNGNGGPRSLASASTVKKGARFSSTVCKNNNTMRDRDDTRSPSRDYYAGGGREDCTDDDVQFAAIMMGAHSVAQSILSLAVEGGSSSINSSCSSSSDNEDEEQTTTEQQPPSQLVELASLLISYGLVVPAVESPTTILPVIAGGHGNGVFMANTSSNCALKSKSSLLSMSSTLIESSGDSFTSSGMIVHPPSTGKKQKSHPRVNTDGSIRLNARQRRTLRRAQDRAVKALVTVMMSINNDKNNNNNRKGKMSEEEALEAVKLLCSQQATVFGSPPAVVAGPARIGGGRGSAKLVLSPLPIKSFGGSASPQVKGPSSMSSLPTWHKSSFVASS